MSPGRRERLELLASFQGRDSLPMLLQAAFQGRDVAPAAVCERVVVGGGLAGVLLALRASLRDPSGLVLLESEQTLGGRSFFSSPWLGVGSPRSRFETLLERGLFGGEASGPGFESFSPDGVPVLERHLVALLEEEERAFVEAFCAMAGGIEPLARRSFVVKKEISPLSEHLHAPTEILTRKDAEVLAALIASVEAPALDSADSADSAQTTDAGSANAPAGTGSGAGAAAPHANEGAAWRTAFAESPFWKEIPKAQKENLTPFLEAVAGFEFGRFAWGHVAHVCRHAFDHDRQTLPATLRRDAGLELALELVLRVRGVDVRTSARAMRIDRMGAPEKGASKGLPKGFSIVVGDDAFPSVRALEAKQVFLCVPLARTLSVLGREALNPGQSKLVSRHRPRSLVAVEYPGCPGILATHFPTEPRPGDVLWFPVERARGIITSTGRLVVSGWLDFENSLQAPPVRELIGRLRKAATRVLRPEAMRMLSGTTPGLPMVSAGAAPGAGGTAPVGTAPKERVVLLPVGLASPQELVARETCLEVRTAWQGLVACGDGYTSSPLPWKNVIHSVHEAGSLLLKDP